MGMGNFSLSWVCLSLDTTDWGEEDPAFWKPPNESSAFFLTFSRVSGQKTQIIREKHASPFWDDSWFPTLCIDNISICTTRVGVHWQCSCMYYEDRCALKMFLCVSWGQVCTDNVPVCIMRTCVHWQCFCMYHEDRCTLIIFCMYHEGRCTLTMFLYVSWGQVCTDNFSVCIMRAGAH